MFTGSTYNNALPRTQKQHQKHQFNSFLNNCIFSKNLTQTPQFQLIIMLNKNQNYNNIIIER